MDSVSIPVYEVIDPAKKDAKYINDSITNLRRNIRALVDPIRVRKNKQILFGQQSMDKIKAEFKDRLFLANTEFIPIGVWSRILNIIIEEITKVPPKAELKAQDSTAISDKKDDILLLRTKHIYENDVNAVNEKIGDPPQRIGKENFKGNIDEFERLNLDPSDPDDIDFYEQSGFQRLKYEIAGQKLINNIMKLNRFDNDTLRKFIIDILATLTCSIQVMVDAITGEIKYRYVAPEEAKGIYGDSEDGSDDICNAVERQVTIMEWMGQVGNDFVWDRDWRLLLSALNFANGSKYTGFVRGGITYDCSNDHECMTKMGMLGAAPLNVDWNLAFGFKIFSGYIEWSTMEATGTYLARYGSGDLLPQRIDYNYQLNKKEQTEYYKESFYQEQMYKSYYLLTSSISQMIYGWGKVYYQQLYGGNDEYARGTLRSYRFEGLSAAEISEPYIHLLNSSFYRMKWVVSKAKPQDEEFLYNELIEISKGFQKQFPQNANTPGANGIATLQNSLQQAINYQRENFVKIRFFPQAEGKVIPQVPQFQMAKNGIDPITIGLQAITEWCEAQIAAKIGLNDMRLGAVQSDREGYKLNVAETQYSLNSTGYVYRMMQHLKTHTAAMTLNISQDIVRFEDSIPYKWLQKLMGFEQFENLKLLKDFASHRYGLYIEDYNAQLERQKLSQAADKALDTGDGRGGISIVEWGIIMGEEDYKYGLKLLGYYKYKAEKKKRQQELQTLQIQQQNAMALKKQDEVLQDKIMMNELKREQLREDGYITAARIAAQAKVDVKQMGEQAEGQKIVQKTEAAKEIEQNKTNLAIQQSLVK